MTTQTGRRETEADFQTFVTGTLDLFGWWWFHDADSRRNREGLADILAIHPGAGRLLFAELKDARRKPTPAQVAFLEMVRLVRHPPEARLWRPRDRGDVLATLDWRCLR